VRRQPKWPKGLAPFVERPASPPQPTTPFDPVLTTWDDLHAAIQRILTAQPYQMTEAAERLDNAHGRMREAIMQYGMVVYAAVRKDGR